MELKAGDKFQWNGKLYIVFKEIGTGKWAAINLQTGQYRDIPSSEPIKTRPHDGAWREAIRKIDVKFKES